MSVQTSKVTTTKTITTRTITVKDLIEILNLPADTEVTLNGVCSYGETIFGNTEFQFVTTMISSEGEVG